MQLWSRPDLARLRYGKLYIQWLPGAVGPHTSCGSCWRALLLTQEVAQVVVRVVWQPGFGEQSLEGIT
jgi:hypothetical protein